MSDDRSSRTRKCKPDSSKPPHDARRSRDKRNHWANAAAPGTPRSTLRRERPLETLKAIGPWPLEAPSRPLPEAAQLDRHTTFSAAWDNGISLYVRAGTAAETRELEQKLSDAPTGHFFYSCEREIAMWEDSRSHVFFDFGDPEHVFHLSQYGNRTFKCLRLTDKAALILGIKKGHSSICEET